MKAMLCAAAIAVGVSPAAAGTASFSIPPQSATATGVGAGVNVTVSLPAAGNPAFAVNFVLPDDYAQNTVAKVALYLSTPAAPCVARLAPAQMVRLRPGLPIVNNLSGFAAQNGAAKLSFPENGALVQKVFTISPSSAFSGQQKRDAFIVEFKREADSTDDTCSANVFVQAIDVRYTTP